PIPVAGDNVFAAITAGLAHTCGLRTDGVIACWGDNSSGQLGANLLNSVSDGPAFVRGSFTAVSAGSYHTCALNSVGAAFCWGDSDTLYQSNTPLPVAGGIRFRSISAGRVSTCGISTAGTAFCWGDNSYWQLGVSNTFNSDTPVPVSGGHADFTAVTVGVRHA